MTLVLHPDVTKYDFHAIPEQHRRTAVKILLALRDDDVDVMAASVPLRPSRVALDLTGCRSLRFGGEAYDDAFRVVFMVEEADILVLAVGPRQGSEVFRTAQERLRPPAPRRHIRPPHNSPMRARRTS